MLKLTFTANLFPPPFGLGHLVSVDYYFFVYFSHTSQSLVNLVIHVHSASKRHGTKDFINPGSVANSPSYLKHHRIFESTTQLTSSLLSANNAIGESSSPCKRDHVSVSASDIKFLYNKKTRFYTFR
jgi:hypothetical protein